MHHQKIIIIGASSGLGKELALLLAQQQNKVAITGRRTHLLQDIHQQYPEQLITATFDVTATDAPQQVSSLIEQLGGLDLLIYNAGYGDTSAAYNIDIEKKTTATNVTGFVAIVAPAFTYFLQQGYGQIAVTSSIAALRGNSWAPAYSASKSFMSTYAEGLNMKAEKLGKKVTVTDIRPGFLDTKAATGNKRFWIVAPQKAARQIVAAIEQKKRVVYISKRWWLVAQLLKVVPYNLYKKFA